MPLVETGPYGLVVPSGSPARPATLSSATTWREAAPTSSSSRLFSTGPIGDPRVVQTGVVIESSDNNETLLDTVARCLRDGAIVTPTQVDCRHAPGSLESTNPSVHSVGPSAVR
jgi:hypothetical protein